MQGLTRDEYARASEWASDSRCGAGLSLRVPSEHHRIGNTKVFMRREIHDKLEEERSRLLVRQALSIQVCVCVTVSDIPAPRGNAERGALPEP